MKISSKSIISMLYSFKYVKDKSRKTVLHQK